MTYDPDVGESRDEYERRITRAQIEANTRDIAAMKPKVERIHAILEAAEGTFRTLEFLSRVVKPLMILSAAAVALYQFIAHHK